MDRLSELLPGLLSAQPAEVAEADGALEKLCFEIGRPGNENERKELAKAIVSRLEEESTPAAGRILLLRKLEFLGKWEVVTALGKILLSGDDPEVREAARRALEANPSPLAKKKLREALGKTQGRLRAGVCRSLGRRRDSLALAGLMEVSADDDPQVRIAAIESLALLGEINSRPVIERALSNVEGIELQAVRRAYLRLADELVANSERGTARRIYEHALTMSPEMKSAALLGIARAGFPSEVDAIIEGLTDPSGQVRGAAREAASILKAPRMTAALLKKYAAATGALRVVLVGVLVHRAERLARNGNEERALEIYGELKKFGVDVEGPKE